MIRFQYGLATILALLSSSSPVPAQGGKTATGMAPPAADAQAVLSAPAIARPRPEYQAPIGQTYVYAAHWRVFDAGMATLRMEKAGPESRVVGTADAAGTVALLFHVQDRLESFFDPASFCSRNISRHMEEGFRRVETNITFDYQGRKSVSDHKNLKKKESRHEEHEIPICVTDLLSGIYYVASLPLKPGLTFTFPLNDGGETVTVSAHAEAREQVTTPAGTFTAIRVQPETSSPVIRSKGKIWIWYSDDAARVPVQMRARMEWGTLTFVLQRIDKK